ncbi:hypothetical protein FVEN_g12776 [Fusarium venenatum]|nr:hypothetical protein FVEN_g12776 [Fusarium venenatum]
MSPKMISTTSTIIQDGVFDRVEGKGPNYPLTYDSPSTRARHRLLKA